MKPITRQFRLPAEWRSKSSIKVPCTYDDTLQEWLMTKDGIRRIERVQRKCLVRLGWSRDGKGWRKPQ